MVNQVPDRPDALYWRWSYRAPVQFIPLEDVWFDPGDGPCVDGYFYWHVGKYLKRLDLETWRSGVRRKALLPTSILITRE